MPTTPTKPAPRKVNAVSTRRRPDALGFIHCSYCAYPVPFSPNWAQQKPCPSCGYKFPDLLQAPISAPIPVRPISLHLQTPAAAPSAAARPTPKPRRLFQIRNLINHQPAAPKSRPSTRIPKPLISAFLWGGTAYGVVGLLTPQCPAALRDSLGWIAAIVVALLIAHFATLPPIKSPHDRVRLFKK